MQVCFITNGVPTDRYPLLGIFEFDQARELVKLGVDVVLLAIDTRSFRRRRKWGLSAYERNGVSVVEYNVPVGRAPLTIQNAIGRIIASRVYHIVYKDDSPDLFHAHFTQMGVIGAHLAQKTGRPLVVTEHSSRMNSDTIRRDVLECARMAYCSADRVIAVSSALSKKIKDHTGVSSIVVPNLLSEDCFYRSERSDHKGFGFVTTCNLIKHKRPEQLLRAFIEVADDIKDVYLGIIGDGELKGKLQSIANMSPVCERIKFYGLQTRESIARIYSDYDCFVLPSMRETYGVAYIEAMAAGLPVISTRCGGPEDFVNDDNGLLISVDDKAALTNALRKMYRTGKSYDSQRIRRFVKDSFSGEQVAKRLYSVYEEVLCEGKHTSNLIR